MEGVLWTINQMLRKMKAREVVHKLSAAQEGGVNWTINQVPRRVEGVKWTINQVPRKKKACSGP